MITLTISTVEEPNKEVCIHIEEKDFHVKHDWEDFMKRILNVLREQYLNEN